MQEEVTDIAQIQQLRGKYRVLWVHVVGLQDPEMNKKIGAFCRLHHLTLDALVHVQRSRLEQFADEYLLITQMIQVHEALSTVQVSIFFSPEFLITFQQGDMDVLQSVRQRLENHQGNIRTAATDYLACAILETVLASYFPCLEEYGEKLEALEEEVIESPSRRIVADIHHVKRDLLSVRRAIWPLRDGINALLRDSEKAFSSDAILHLRDCYSTAVQIIDFLETYRELASDLMDMYLSSISNRMNEVMKVLAVITTVFVPPSLIASIYGMNFHGEKSPYNMPELNCYFGYPLALAAMLLVSLTVLVLFKFKGWLGEKPSFGRRQESSRQP